MSSDEQHCTSCGSAYAILEEDRAFYATVSPVLAGTTAIIPSPTLCPDCRQQRRLAWRNERTIYQRTCDLCKKNIVSSHHPDHPYPVHCVQCWWGDGWDPHSYGLPFDSQQPFFEQFLDLQRRVPQLSMQNDEGITSMNSEYCYDISRCKNCYRIIGSWFLEDCMYSLCVNHSKDLVDCNTVSENCEMVYESLDSQHLYHCQYVQNCENCSDCFFGIDLKGCSDCIACVGLRQKRFCLWNEQLTEEEFRTRTAGINPGSWAQVRQLREKFDAWSLQFPRLYANLQNCEGCSGNNLFNCKDVRGWSIFNAEACKYVDRSDGPVHSYDIINTGGPQWCYDCVTPDESYRTHFSTWCWKCKNVMLSDNCHSCESCLGCIGLKRAKYCILNKQYTKEEYERLALQIIRSLEAEGAWGGHLPITHSPYAYNESAAMDYYPLTEKEVTRRGWNWRQNLPYTTGKQTVEWDQVPDAIRDVPDTFTQEILSCTTCGKNFKVVEKELAFLRSMPAPIPRQCFDCRHLARFRRKTPTHIWTRPCDSCGKQLESTYAPGRPEKVYCEECILREVY